jgi:hypothetical protein
VSSVLGPISCRPVCSMSDEMTGSSSFGSLGCPVRTKCIPWINPNLDPCMDHVKRR